MAWWAYPHRRLTCMLWWHSHTYVPASPRWSALLGASFGSFRKTSAGKAESTPATGLIVANCWAVLDSRSVSARNACCLRASCTARLLLFLPTALLFQPQWCVFIAKSTRSLSVSLLLNCIFLWWELHPFTCFSCVVFLFVFACSFIFLHWNSVSQTQPSGSVSSADLITNFISPF